VEELSITDDNKDSSHVNHHEVVGNIRVHLLNKNISVVDNDDDCNENNYGVYYSLMALNFY